MDDASVDTHLCIRCNQTIVGINSYLDHRRGDCLATGRSTNSGSSPTSPGHHSGDQANGGNLPQATGDVPDIPFLPDVPELPDFFLSLDLQRIAPIVEPVEESIDDDDDDDDADDGVDPLRPPQGHTGGKWRPGSRPSIMQGLAFHRDSQRDSSPERLPDILEKMGCAPCGRIFRDKYTYQRHLESALHRKRSIRNAKIIQAQCPVQDNQTVEPQAEAPLKSRTIKRPVRYESSSIESPSHRNGEKINKPQYRCSLCFRWFKDRQTLNRHMGNHRRPEGLHCAQCTETFTEDRELRLHLKTHKQHQKCCGMIFTTIKGFREHKEREHVAIREWLICDRCNKKYRTSRALREHLCEDSTVKIRCVDCDYIGVAKNLALHRRTTHEGKKIYSCTKCNYHAARHGQLWRHMKLHEGVKAYQCPYCDYSCALVENLRAHILKGSKHKGLKVYPCDKCSFSTNNAIEAKHHADSHQLS